MATAVSSPSLRSPWLAVDEMLKRILHAAESVPENRRVMPRPQIFLDYIDKTKFIADSDILMDIYNQLLISAMDQEKKDDIHPSFMLILCQLSDIEVLIIEHLRIKNCKMIKKLHWDAIERRFYKNEIVQHDFPSELFHDESKFFMLCNHMHKLDLVDFNRLNSKAEHDVCGKQTASIETYELKLSEFGKLFVESCCR